MKLAFVLFTFFPFGGLTKDLVAIARLCQQRGHQVKIFAESSRGAAPEDLQMEVHPVHGLGNHTKNKHFAEHLPKMLSLFKPDLVVGFNKMPKLDVYYAADGCFAEKNQQRSFFYYLMPRTRHFEAYEKAVFSADTQTDILMIAERQIAIYQSIYATPDERFHLLPPGISRDRIAPIDPWPQIAAFRQRWKLGLDEKLVLMVGSGFRTKGLDRA
ncbi:MAG: glycosyltransferase family 4 protein, partial [bacterium]|nr:glycosyltransferase family 4 protein [bacterium]